MESIMSALFGGGGRPTMRARGDIEARDVDAQAEVKMLLRGASQAKVEASVVKSDTSRGGSLARAGGAADGEAAAAAAAAALDAARARASGAAPGPGSTAAASAGGAPHAPPRRGVPQWALTGAYGVTNLASVVMIVVANKMVLFTHKFGFAITLTCLHALFTAVGMAAMAAAGVFPRKAVPLSKTLPIAAVYVGFVVFNNLSIQLNPLGAAWGGGARPGRATAAARRQGSGSSGSSGSRAPAAGRRPRAAPQRAGAGLLPDCGPPRPTRAPRAPHPASPPPAPSTPAPPGFYQLSKLAITPVLVAIEWLAYSKRASGRVLASIALLLVGITLCTVTDSQVRRRG
jgi:hypothetical protein